ncbi:hypothetical protein ACX122_06975 [Kosakonia cowanii]
MMKNVYVNNIDRLIASEIYEIKCLADLLESVKNGHQAEVAGVYIDFDGGMQNGLMMEISKKEKQLKMLTEARDAANEKIAQILLGD